MARVYLDASALYLHWDTPAAVVAPDGERAVELLRSDGHQVTVLGATAATAAAWASRLPRAEQAAPEAPNREPAWLIVGDRARCRMRVAGLRTVLVGGGPAPNTGRGRCDLEAADLHGAVLAVIGGAAIA